MQRSDERSERSSRGRTHLSDRRTLVRRQASERTIQVEVGSVNDLHGGLGFLFGEQGGDAKPCTADLPPPATRPELPGKSVG